MKSITILLIIVSTVVVLSCKDDSTSLLLTTSPPPTTGFSLKITVKDSSGRPVPNLRVIGGSLTSIRNFNGFHLQAWVNGVYLARLIAEDTVSNSLLFRDSIFMVFADVDVGNPPSWLGYTSSAGELTLNDADRFPGVFSLSSIPETNDDPTPLSQFSILDTAVFIIRDTLTLRQQAERRVIRNGTNTIDVQWTPSTTTAITVADVASAHECDVLTKGERDTYFDIGAAKSISRNRTASPLATTIVRFDLSTRAKVNLSVLQPDGKNISTIIDQHLSPGTHYVPFSVLWNSQQQGSVTSQKAVPASWTAKAALDWKLYQNYPNPFN